MVPAKIPDADSGKFEQIQSLNPVTKPQFDKRQGKKYGYTQSDNALYPS